MMKRALAIVALSLISVWPGAAQTTPVINGQTGSVTISPQTLDWLRQRLAEEEERLRQLQIAIQQVARAVATSQTASQSLVPTPAEAAIPATPAETPIAGGITIDAEGAIPAITPRPPLIPPAHRRTTPAATRPPLPGVIRSETTSPIVTRPPLIPAPIRRDAPAIPGQSATAAPDAPLTSPLSPVTIAPLPVTLTEPVAIAPLGPEPSAPVSITPPPVGPPMPSVTIAPAPGPVPAVTPAPGRAIGATTPRRTPRILIPSFMPNQPPSATDSTNDGLDRTGSPVTLPPGSDGDDLVIPEGIVGANSKRGQPSASPNADPLRSGQSMADVRRLKGTPALISRDDTAGTETWTYPDGTLVFRAGRLSQRQVASAEVPLLSPYSAPVTAPVAAPAPVTKRPAIPPIAANPRQVPSIDEVIAPAVDHGTMPEVTSAPKKTAIVKRVAGHREKIRTTTRRGKSVTTSRRGRTISGRRSSRSIRTVRYHKMRRWARAHRRSHRIALRQEAPRARGAAMKTCRKCRIARAYLRPIRRTTHGKVAGWRGQIRTRSTTAATTNGVKIIQRR